MMVYVLHTDWIIMSGESGSDVSVYSTKEKALAAFAKVVDEIKKIDYDGIYGIDCDCFSWEEDNVNGYFSIYRNGYYCMEHSDVYIEQCIVDPD